LDELDDGIDRHADKGSKHVRDIKKPSPGSSGAQPPAKWPALQSLRLTSNELDRRRGAIGGSDANVILSGSPEKLRQLWLVKRGEAEPADFSSELAVMLGCWTESFNRQWFEQLTGDKIVDDGKQFTCARHRWRRCTVDGLIAGRGAIWEAKHTNAFTSGDEILDRYMPQLQHNMAVTGHQQAALSVIFGNHKYEIFEIASHWLYQRDLLEAEEQFWDCVKAGKEPLALPAPPPPRPVGIREVCLEGNNAWASAAIDWLAHRAAAKAHAPACSSLK